MILKKLDFWDHCFMTTPTKDHPVNVYMYVGFISWAFQEAWLRQEFEEATGTPPFIMPSPHPLAQMIDKACGVDKANYDYFRAFVKWVSKNHWGADCTPTVDILKEFEP